MASAVVGALRVNLGLDSAQFIKGTRDAKSSMSGLQKTMIGVGAAIAAALAGAAFEMAKLVRNSINVADEISKAAQKIGIGTEELSRLRYAADLSGVSFEGLQKGVLALNRNMAGIGGESKKVTSAFAQMGIETRNTDGTLKSSTQVLKEMADVFQRMPDGAQKSALAMAVLGKSGADMIPLLNGGSEALEGLLNEADRFGIVIDEETGRKAEAFNDNLRRLSGVFDSLATQIAADMLPELLDLSNFLIDNSGAIRQLGRDTIQAIKDVKDFGRGVKDATAALVDMSGVDVGAVFRQIRQNIILTSPMLAGFIALYDKLRGAGRAARTLDEVGLGSGGGMKSLNDIIAESGTGFVRATAKAEQLFNTVQNGGGGGGRAGGGALARLRDEADEANRAFQRLANEARRVQEQLDPALAKFRRVGDQQATILGARAAGIITQQEASRLIGLTVEVTDGFKMIDEKLPFMAKAANDNTRVIADSFAQMADRVNNSLQGLAQSIQRGDFLGILGGLLNTFVQLGSVGAFGSGLAQRINSRPPGFANGTNFAPGGVALVGERGPELVNLPRGSQVIPNHKMGGGIAQIVPSPYFDVVVDGRIINAAPAVVQAGAAVSEAQSFARARRTVRR
jgi:phage-related tail protein